MTDIMQIGTGGPSTAENRFRGALVHEAADAGHQGRFVRVLELGTRRWIPDFATHHAAWAPPGVEWVKSDMEAGLDVDVVADAHDLETEIDAGSFDAYVAVSVYEHLRRPWVAALSAAAVLRPGGLLFVCTHQTFPLHGYPHDYFRFSAEALAGIFDDAGFEILDGGYTYPASIIPPAEVTRWNPGAAAYLNVDVLARAPA